MTMGSQMVIVSKGGTNTFPGSVFEYFRNNALPADHKSTHTPTPHVAASAGVPFAPA